MKTNGFTTDQILATLMRDGDLCSLAGILAGCQRRATTANHRLNRKAGGSRFRNGMSNSCAICDWCNNAIESDSEAAAEARRRGVKLREGDDPATTAMYSPFYRQMVQPGDEEFTLLGVEYQPRELEI